MLQQINTRPNINFPNCVLRLHFQDNVHGQYCVNARVLIRMKQMCFTEICLTAALNLTMHAKNTFFAKQIE